MRDKILSLISGKKPKAAPTFSGLIHITEEGLSSAGLTLEETHHDAGKMARASASTYKLTGLPSATLPLDLCSSAEALGAELIFYKDEEMQFPQVKKLLFTSTRQISDFFSTTKITAADAGRIPIILQAIERTKNEIGNDAVVSGLIPGPYTLLIYICKAQNLFSEMKSDPQMVFDALKYLTEFLSDIAKAYLNAGADFITIHDMGGSAGFVGPSVYEKFVFPSERDLIAMVSKACVLSVCGKMDKSLHLLGQTGAQAISLDHTTNLPLAREILKDQLLFGNIDPVEILARGDQAQIVEAVTKAKEAGVDAIWPGCDLVIQTPLNNLKLFHQGDTDEL